MTTCLENLEMSGSLTAVREMSGILLKVRELSGKNLSRKSGLKLFIVSCICASILDFAVLALDLEGVHDLKLHHPSSSVATSNQ